MKRMTIILAIGFLAQVAQAQEGPQVRLLDPNTFQVIRYPRPLDAASDCSGQDCAGRYWLKRRGPGVTQANLPAVIRVTATGHDFTVVLDRPLPELTGLRLVAADLRVRKGNAAEPLEEEEFALAPVLYVDPGDTRALIYRGLTRMTPGQTPTIAITDLKEKLPITGIRVVGVEPYPDRLSHPTFAHRLRLSRPLPRGKKIAVTVGGLEERADIKAEAQVDVEAYPATRDDATLYFLGQWNFSGGDNDSGAVDLRWAPDLPWSPYRTETKAVLDVNAGSDALKLPDVGSLAVSARFWPERAGAYFDNFTASPTFRMDKDNDNRDLGVDLTYEFARESWYQTMARRRARARLSGADPITVRWGASFQPSVAVEAGWHLASEAEEVDDTFFARLVPGLTLLLETGNWKLTTSYRGRLLTTRELVKDDELVSTDRGYRTDLRVELGRSFGPYTISVVHIDGEQPPSFKKARATTLGVGVKY